MKIVQAQLPFRKSIPGRITTPVPLPPRHPLPPSQPSHTDLATRLKRFVAGVLTAGFWYCNSCEHRTERIEGEHGQPAHCQHCGSPRIVWIPPVAQQEGVV